MEKLKEIWKGQSEDQRRKIIAYTVVGILGMGMFTGVYLIKSDDKVQRVDELSNPDAKAGKNYSSRLEANQMDRKDSGKINMKIDEIFGTSTPAPVVEEKEEASAEIYYEPDYSAPKNSQTNYSGSAGGGGGSYQRNYYSENHKNNDSEFYEEQKNILHPSESKKEEALNLYSKKNETEIKKLEENLSEEEFSNVKQDKKSGQIKARLLSQGYVNTGKSISFVLLEKVKINKVEIKRGQIITGVAQEQNNRLMVKFSTIKVDGKIIPVDMQLYGSDGMEGLPISGTDQQSTTRTSSVINSTIGSIPIVGGIANDAIQNNSNHRKSSIKLTPNISCIIIYTI